VFWQPCTNATRRTKNHGQLLQGQTPCTNVARRTSSDAQLHQGVQTGCKIATGIHGYELKDAYAKMLQGVQTAIHEFRKVFKYSCTNAARHNFNYLDLVFIMTAKFQ